MQTREKAILGYGNAANYLTVLGLVLSLSSCFFVLNENLKISIILFSFSGLCDLFDGVIARRAKRTDLEKEFGIQLDTVVDVVSFGITPVVIAYSSFDAEWYALVVYIFYVACAVIRLAYYNTSAISGLPMTHYRGVPVTYIALILPVVLLFHSSIITTAALAIVGTLFILNIKIPKPRGVWYVLFPIIAAVMAVLWWIL
jgi:CDP-diacylglycerol--serine O-phosphatidyltransferase